MSEVNAPWKRDNLFVKRLTAFGFVVTPMLWTISYYAAWPAMEAAVPWQWFTALSVATFIGALGGTVGSIIGLGHIITDAPPLEGSNHY